MQLRTRHAQVDDLLTKLAAVINSPAGEAVKNRPATWLTTDLLRHSPAPELVLGHLLPAAEAMLEEIEDLGMLDRPECAACDIALVELQAAIRAGHIALIQPF